jgi:hypothetical protein
MSRRSWLAAAAVPACLFAAACGAGGTAGTAGTAKPSTPASHGPNVAALRTAMVAAMKQARSVRVTGSTPEGSKRVGLDVVLTRAGGVAGRITLNGHSLKVLTSPRHVYLGVTKSLAGWQKLPPDACALMCGKWLKEPARELSSLAGNAGWRKIVAAFEGPLAGSGASYAGTATVGGQPALKLSLDAVGTIYVAAHGTPYLLRLESGTARISYSDWNTAVLPPPPPASKVVTVSMLAAGLNGG